MAEDCHDLIEQCIRNEEKAWGKFIERFSGLLYFSARERLKRNGFVFGKQDIEDIVQSVFLEIWEKRRLEEIRDRKKITAWLSIMAQTRALNYMMRRRKERLLREEEFYKIEDLKVDSPQEADDGLSLKLEGLIDGFDAREKIICRLNMIYGKKHREIAGFMKMSINTVSTIIARKKKLLRERLKDIERK